MKYNKAFQQKKQLLFACLFFLSTYSMAQTCLVPNIGITTSQIISGDNSDLEKNYDEKFDHLSLSLGLAIIHKLTKDIAIVLATDYRKGGSDSDASCCIADAGLIWTKLTYLGFNARLEYNAFNNL